MSRTILSNSRNYQHTVVFDLDGTLACNNHRLQHLRDGNWDLYNSLCTEDPVLEGQAALLRCMYAGGYRVIVMTARLEQQRDDTEEWIDKHELPIDGLILRDNPYMETHTYKELAVRGLSLSYDIKLYVDDDPVNCEIMQALGIPVLYIHSAYYEKVRVRIPVDERKV